MRLLRPLALWGISFIFFALSFRVSAIDYKNYKKCYQKFYPNSVDDVVRALETARKNPALAKLDDYHSQMVEQMMGSLPEVVFQMTKDKDGKEIISISLGNLQGPWKPEDYPKYFEQFCKQVHPDKKFCAERLQDKYKTWMEWLKSLDPKLQPIVKRAFEDPNYKWQKDLEMLNLIPPPSALRTIGEVGFDDTIVGIPGIQVGEVMTEQGQSVPNAYVVPVQMSNTGKVYEYVTIGDRPSEAPNPLFFMGVDEREWNCYIQSKVRVKLKLHGKPIC